jgi:hypothetical protein
LKIHVHSLVDPRVPKELAARLTSAEFLVDPATYQVVSFTDSIHPAGRLFRDVERTVTFTDYRAVNGVSIPFSVEERIDGQISWQIHLQSVEFGAQLDPHDLELQ